MTIRIPDTLTTEQSEKYIVSIRLWPDGFSFSGHIPGQAGSFFYRETMLAKGTSYLSSLKELFFTFEFLTWTYKRTYVLPAAVPFTLVPSALFDERRKDKILAFNLSDPPSHPLHNTLETLGAELLFAMEEELYEFCSRTLLNPQFIHPMTPQLELWQKQSFPSGKRRMYLVVQAKTIDMACFADGKLIVANSFKAERAEDILYHTLHLWNHTGMDQLTDELYLYGDHARRVEAAGIFQHYLRNVCPMQIPSEVYLAGVPLAPTPFDLISLFVCES